MAKIICFIGNIIFLNGYGSTKGQSILYYRKPRPDDCHWIDRQPFKEREHREPVVIKYPFNED
jgi:hypothetical protein